MRLTPQEFETLYSIFIGAILLFFAFAGIKILSIKYRETHPPPRPPRPAGGGGTGEYRERSVGTFGTSGIGASDMAPAGTPQSTTEMASSDIGTWDSSDTGGDSGGGGDFSGGGGDSGGGGSSGSWS